LKYNLLKDFYYMKRFFGKVPLERALSKLGILSRSETRSLALAGRVKVNGRTIKDPRFMVTPEKDLFSIDGRKIEKDIWTAILFNKPGSVVTTRSDEKGRRTVFDVLPEEFSRLHPVGRLDMATTGLLLLTNDTRLSSWLTDPENSVERTYAVTVAGTVKEEELSAVRKGITDAGDFLRPEEVKITKSCGKETHLTVKLTEGKNREIRRIFSDIGHEVTKLKRISFGSFQLGNLQPGEFRRLKREEIPPHADANFRH